MLWTSGLWTVMPFYLKRRLKYASLPVSAGGVCAFLLSSVDVQRTQVGGAALQGFLSSAQPLALLLAFP